MYGNSTSPTPDTFHQRHEDSVGAHRMVSYNPDWLSRERDETERSQSFFKSQDRSAEKSTHEVDRSRSRSIGRTRTASENLLVSLDESILPPQITKVRPEISAEGLGLGIAKVTTE